MRRACFALSFFVLGACGDDDTAAPPVRCAPRVAGNPCQALPASTKTPPALVGSGLDERCNALDDDLDGATDEGDACAAVCSEAAVDAAAAALVWPAADSQTTGTNSLTVPELTAVTGLPAWCRAPTAGDAEHVAVRCGEVLDVGAAGLAVTTLSIAPGGVVRVTADATLTADALLVCPGGVIEAGGALGEVGRDLVIDARKALVLGLVETAAGPDYSPIGTSNAGTSGALTLSADRLLLAGTLTTAGRARGPGWGRYLDGGNAAPLLVTVPRDDGEAFLSGRLDSRGGDGGANLGCGAGGPGGAGGDLTLESPVCCHGLELAISGASGGDGGTGDDGFEGAGAAPIGLGALDVSLCDGEDRYAVTLAPGDVVDVAADPPAGAPDLADIDLELVFDGTVVARSEQVGSHESVVAPAAGAFVVRVYAVGPVTDPGVYRLTVTAHDDGTRTSAAVPRRAAY